MYIAVMAGNKVKVTDAYSDVRELRLTDPALVCIYYEGTLTLDEAKQYIVDKLLEAPCSVRTRAPWEFKAPLIIKYDFPTKDRIDFNLFTRRLGRVCLAEAKGQFAEKSTYWLRLPISFKLQQGPTDPMVQSVVLAQCMSLPPLCALAVRSPKETVLNLLLGLEKSPGISILRGMITQRQNMVLYSSKAEGDSWMKVPGDVEEQDVYSEVSRASEEVKDIIREVSYVFQGNLE